MQWFFHFLRGFLSSALLDFYFTENTDAGRKKFIEWLESPIEKFDIRVSWLIQLFFAGGLSDEKVIELLTCFLQQFENAIECYSKNETNKYITSPRDKFFKDLTLDYGVAVNMAIKDWIKNTIERIKNKEWEKYKEVSHE